MYKKFEVLLPHYGTANFLQVQLCFQQNEAWYLQVTKTVISQKRLPQSKNYHLYFKRITKVLDANNLLMVMVLTHKLYGRQFKAKGVPQ